jgi:nicotinamidase-related amidase
MLRTNYPVSRTGLLIVDTYNDFLSDGGKLWPKIQAVAESVDLIAHLRSLIAKARQLGIVIFYVPHHRWHEGDYDGWRYPNPWQIASDCAAVFADGTWGSDWHPDLLPEPGDVVVEQHWGQNGFADTDLNLQLRQRDIDKVIVVGLVANTCIEATARHAVELGYHVTLVPDATAANSPEAMHAAHKINGPTFAHAILTTDAVIAALARS